MATSGAIFRNISISIMSGKDADTVRTEDVPYPGYRGPPGKPLSVFATLFGECMCADAFRVRPSDLRRSSAPGSARTPFLRLDGIEVISLGSIEKPGGHSPRERVRETAAQLATDPTRLVKVGYLVEEGDGNGAVGSAASQETPVNVGASNGQAPLASSALPQSQPSGSAGGPSIRTELVALEAYEETYPGDLERSLSKAAREAMAGMRSRDFEAAHRGFEKLVKEQKNQMKKKTPQGVIHHSAYMAGINVHNMAVCRLLTGATQVGDAGGDAIAAAAEEQALVLFLEAAVLKRSSFGPNHPEVATTLVEVGIRKYALDDFDGAFDALNEARRILSSSLGPDHPKVAAVLNNSGCVHFRRGEGNVAALTCFQEAKDIQERAMETGTGARGELDLLHVATTLCNVGYMKFRMKNYEEAGAIFEDALLVQQSVLGDNHQTIKDTLSNIALANAFHS